MAFSCLMYDPVQMFGGILMLVIFVVKAATLVALVSTLL
jgi:hypothetical protein